MLECGIVFKIIFPIWLILFLANSIIFLCSASLLKKRKNLLPHARNKVITIAVVSIGVPFVDYT